MRQIILLLILSLFLFSDVGASQRAVTGGWWPIEDTKDSTVQEIGKFAVSEHNKEADTGLKYVDVLSGETQVVAGTNYRLVIAAKDGVVSNKYQAVVWDKPWLKFRNLTSFHHI